MARARFLLILVAVAGLLFLLSLGCDELITETIEITIAGHPTADFSYSPDSSCIPLTVTFKDASSGPITEWRWNFGDSAKIWSESNKDTSFRVTLYKDSGDDGGYTYTYDSVGSFTVTLTVFAPVEGSDEPGSDNETKRRAVIAGHNVDSFALSDNIVCPGDSITATIYGASGIDTWRWEYGNGQIRTVDSLVQRFAYTLPGEYEFKLTLTGDCGSTIFHDTIHVIHCAAPQFYAALKSGCIDLSGLLVKFFDNTVAELLDTAGNTVGNVVQWDWDFGNGQTETYFVTTDTLEMTYTSIDTFPVTLTVTTDSGGVTSVTDTIITHAIDADFTAAPVAGCYTPGHQLVVAFSRESTGDTLWIWDFGDGGTSELQNPYHAYTAPGVYDVQLFASNVCGSGDELKTMSNFIEYADPLDSLVAFTATSDSLAFDTTFVDDPPVIELIDTTFWYTLIDISATAEVVHYDWDFGDGSGHSSAGPSVVHGYDSLFIYDISLSRFNTCDSFYLDSSVILVLP